MRQRGAAIITALLVVALVAITASFLLAQQSQALTRTAATVARAQARAYADTAVQWARGILYDDARQSNSDHLGEPWAAGLAALQVDNATLSGTLTDEQGRFNLNNLVRNGAVHQGSVQAFKRLLESLALAPDLAGAVVDWIDPDSNLTSPGGAEDAAYLALASPYRTANKPLVTVDELLRVKGFDAKAVNALRPFVTALPAVTRLNLNTASLDVLAASMPELEESQRLKLAKERLEKPFKDLADIKSRYPTIAPLFLNEEADAKSDYFTASVAVASGSVQIRTRALLKRETGKWPAIIWQEAF